MVQAVGIDLRRADRDEHVDGIERAEDDQREPRLPIGQLGDVEQMIDMIGQRAVAFPGIERPGVE